MSKEWPFVLFVVVFKFWLAVFRLNNGCLCIVFSCISSNLRDHLMVRVWTIGPPWFNAISTVILLFIFLSELFNDNHLSKTLFMCATTITDHLFASKWPLLRLKQRWETLDLATKDLTTNPGFRPRIFWLEVLHTNNLAVRVIPSVFLFLESWWTNIKTIVYARTFLWRLSKTAHLCSWTTLISSLNKEMPAST